MPAITAGKVYAGTTLVAGGIVMPTQAEAPVTVSASSAGSAHAAGTWVEVTASTSVASQWISVWLSSSTASNGAVSDTIVEIGTGGAGAETVVGQYLAGYREGIAANPHPIAELPLSIAAGTRIAVRVRSVRTATSFDITIRTATLPFAQASAVAYGVDTSDSGGITIADPAGTGTPGAWTQITASTATALQGVHIGPQMSASAAVSAGTILLELATGASSSEVVFASRTITVANTERLAVLGDLYVPWSIPSGTRIAARYTKSASTMPLDLVVHGIPA